jgi:hypothetical protein
VSQLIEILSGDPFFHEVSADALRSLTQGAALRTIPAGAVVCAEGHPSDIVFVLRRGIARTWWRIPPHQRLLRALVCGPAWLCCHGSTATFTTSALTELTGVAIDRRRFDEWVEGQPSVLLRFLACARTTEGTLRERLRQQHRPLTRRVAELLLSYLVAYRHDGDERSTVPLTNVAIAGELGVVERSISSALGELRRADLIRTARGGVVVADLEGLRAHADGETSFVLARAA